MPQKQCKIILIVLFVVVLIIAGVSRKYFILVSVFCIESRDVKPVSNCIKSVKSIVFKFLKTGFNQFLNRFNISRLNCKPFNIPN